MKKDYSVFDVVGPNMIGTSSSHTAGAARLGKITSKIVGVPVKKVDFYLYGSFAETYKGHGTDKALIGGILGFDTEDARIRNSFDLAHKRGVEFNFIPSEIEEDMHPNTVRMEMVLEDGTTATTMGASIGGGNIKLTQINGLDINYDGTKNTLILEVKDVPRAISYVTGLLADTNKNISMISMNNLDHDEYAFLTIQTAEGIDPHVIDEFRESKHIAKMLVLDKF